MSYSTKQQQAVLQCLEQCSEEPISAAALAEQLRLSGNPVGLATVYRQLEKLEQAVLTRTAAGQEAFTLRYAGKEKAVTLAQGQPLTVAGSEF